MNRYLGIIYALIGLVVIGFASSFTEGYTRRLLVAEGGLVETISAVGYFFCIWYISRRGGQAFLKRYLYACITLVFMGMRELGLHTWLFFPGIFRSRYYANPDNPLIQKLIGAAIIILILYLVYQIVVHLTGPFVRGWLRLDRCAVAMAAALGLLVSAMTSDGIARKLAGFNIFITEQTERLVMIFEEVAEMGIPVMIFAGLYYYFEDRKATQSMSQFTDRC